MASLQLLRSKLLPLSPPASTWYESNSRLSDLASGLSVAEDAAAGAARAAIARLAERNIVGMGKGRQATDESECRECRKNFHYLDSS